MELCSILQRKVNLEQPGWACEDAGCCFDSYPNDDKSMEKALHLPIDLGSIRPLISVQAMGSPQMNVMDTVPPIGANVELILISVE